MTSEFSLYNTLTNKKEIFKPFYPPFVGLYVCGPTMYDDPHLGHARPAVTFDLLHRYLKHLGYNVRYVRNITDVGHLENDADEGEDKISKKAKLQQIEPMEVVQYYTLRYHKSLEMLNALPPSIEPRASGHILEQIETIKDIIENGYAYESNGSVYFDVEKYNKENDYGQLSGRKLDEMRHNTRVLEGQQDKKNRLDFSLWKKAKPEHIMKWASPWGEGFPGWHIECSAMSRKYLGDSIDIHGGGLDLTFPHHECEIAQNRASSKKDIVKYWMHNNMVTVNGKKMGKSLGNFITLEDLFTGNNPALEQAFLPMTIRFFMLQAHYRSTLDFSVKALKSAESGLKRLLKTYHEIDKISVSENSDIVIGSYKEKCYKAINDDLNTSLVLSYLFDVADIIKKASHNKIQIKASDVSEIKDLFDTFLFEIMGIKYEQEIEPMHGKLIYKDTINLLLDVRQELKNKKDWILADKIRSKLVELGLEIKDDNLGNTYWS